MSRRRKSDWDTALGCFAWVILAIPMAIVAVIMMLFKNRKR